MPIIQQWVPDYSKLPKSLYDDAFTLVVNPPTEPQSNLYFFHDKTWFADCKHLLGWSREIVHTLALDRADWPHWLLGHGVQLLEDGSFQLSGSDRKCSPEWLIAKAKEAEALLAPADVVFDQWDCDTLAGWPEAIRKEHDAVCKLSSVKFHREQVANEVKFHVMRCNEANAEHHKEYPKKAQ